MATDKTENLLGREIMRLMKASREHEGDALLDEALQGREKTVDSLTRLMSFLIKNFGPYGSIVTEKFWKTIKPFLEESGVDPKDLKKIRYPYSKPGDTKFQSILDEMREEGHDI